MTDKKPNFKSELQNADDREAVPDAEFVLTENLIVVTCPHCHQREEISRARQPQQPLQFHCRNCKQHFTIPDLDLLLKL